MAISINEKEINGTALAQRMNCNQHKSVDVSLTTEYFTVYVPAPPRGVETDNPLSSPSLKYEIRS